MIAPALHFHGACAQAIALYTQAFDITDAHIEYYDDAPAGSGLNEKGDMSGKVMHSNLIIAGSLVNMCDVDAPVTHGDAILLNVMMPMDAVRRAFAHLSEGGVVRVPLGEQFFSPLYGAVEDRFGVRWQLITYEPDA